MNGRVVLLSVLAAAICAGAGPADAVRPYQRFWKTEYESRTPPEIVEDNRPALSPKQEFYITTGTEDDMARLAVMPGETARSSDGPTAGDRALSEYVRATVAAGQGSPVEALEGYQAAVDKDPTNSWLRLKAANAAVQINDLSRAEAILRDLIKLEPENHRAYLLMGELHANRRRYREAQDYYQQVLEVRPGNIEALQKLAQIAYEIDRDLEQVKVYARQILAVDDRNLAALLWNAEACAATGEAEHAAELYARLLRYRPQLVVRMAETARQLLRSGRATEALFLYSKAVELNPRQDALRRDWEATLREVGGDDAVKEAYKEMFERTGDPLHGDAFAGYLRQGNEWEGLAALRVAMLDKNPDHVPALMDMARYHLRRNEGSEAQLYLDGAEMANPMDPDISREIAMSYIQFGQSEKARALLERAVALNPEDVKARATLSTLELQAGNHDVAEKHLRAALDAAPANAELLRQLGALYLARGENRQARELFAQVLIINQFDFETWLQLADLHLRDNDEAALDRLEDSSRAMLQAYPDIEVRYGILAQRHGAFERSRRALERSLADNPRDLRARGALSRTLLHLNDGERAVNLLLEASPLTGAVPELERTRLFFLAQVYSDLYEYPKALATWHELVAANPDDIESHRQRLLVLAKVDQGDRLQDAVNEFVRVFKVNEPTETELTRATVLMQTGDAARAVRLLQRLHLDNPDDERIALELAMAAGEAGDLETAERIYRRIIDQGEASPYFESASNNLGYLFAQKGVRLDEAEKLVMQAHQQNPLAAYILDSLGWVYFQKGDYTKAQTYLERAALLSLNDGEIYLHLGQLYETIGQPDRARLMYERAMAADPKLAQARERRDALLVGADSREPAL